MNRTKRVSTLPKLPPRGVGGHKGLYGHVLVVGGSRGMIGAPTLSGNAALRAGAGLVTLAVPAPVQLAVATLCPCATSIPLACDERGEPDASAVRQLRQAAEGIDVLAMGPGMGRSAGAAQLVRAALEQDKPVVLDADGLNNLLAIDDWSALRRCPMVLTPHPGEFARLTARDVAEIQAARRASAVAAAQQWLGAHGRPPLVLVLKGAGTIVTDGRRVYVNDTGNPGMATGGTGDVLTGVIAALLGQRLDAFDAACLGVHHHGLAGDLAARELGMVSLIATDLLDFLSRAFAGRSARPKK